MAFTSATSWASRVTFKPFAPAAEPAASMVLMNTQNREPGSLDVGRRGADEGRHRLDGGLVGLGGLQSRQDARLYELRNLYRVARCGGKGVFHTCNQCSHFFFTFSPGSAQACV